MKTLLAPVCTLIVLLSCGSLHAADPPKTDRTEDAETITKNILAGADSWNAQDLDANLALLAEDADFVNVLGGWTKGKAATMEGHQRILDRVIRKTYLKVEVLQVRFIKPDVAIAHGTVEMYRRDPQGQPGDLMQKNLMSQVLVRSTDGRWLVTAFQNTKIEPAFAGPPKP
jgi:uncharacterized protein (TIGR02246 family)